ncbi:MAG: cyclic-di-AMP receptor [Peptoniphilus sp.]|nr:cyclic-di-AMP receptor [Peptoniphilus sp.]MDD7363160.1 cyclic-di-AMP receptor [Bacillota bacterium]MDY6044516.1 cyclic-di-AMP receptor [Peptoniphilus sp.]
MDKQMDKMVFAIIADRFIGDFIDELLEADISVTEMASTGGFLKEGNTTVVIGVSDKQYVQLKEILQRIIGDHADKNSEHAGAHVFAIDLVKGLRI